MSKQDRTGVRTAQDLERKYNLGALRDSAKQSTVDTGKIERELRAFAEEINAEVSKKAAKEDIPTKVSQLENDSKYLTSIPGEYVTETELEAKGYLTEVTEDNLPTEYLIELIATSIENAYTEVENEAGGITVIIGHS